VIHRLLQGLRTLVDELSRPLNLALAFFISPLPRRYWRGASGPGIALSAFIQMAACSAGLLQAYTSYAQLVSDDLAEVTAEVAELSGAEKMTAAPAMAFGALTPFGFFAVSTPAWVLAYGALSGLIRIVGYAADHPCGDPILTFVDETLRDVGRGIKSRVRRITGALRSWWRGQEK
jgi:hypothetical protein